MGQNSTDDSVEELDEESPQGQVPHAWGHTRTTLNWVHELKKDLSNRWKSGKWT